MHTIYQSVWENTSENHTAEQKNNIGYQKQKIFFKMGLLKL